MKQFNPNPLRLLSRSAAPVTYETVRDICYKGLGVRAEWTEAGL